MEAGRTQVNERFKARGCASPSRRAACWVAGWILAAAFLAPFSNAGALPDFDRPDAAAEESLRVWAPDRELPRVSAQIRAGGANAYLYALHAKLLFHAGRYKEALRSARQAEKLSPENEPIKGLAVFLQRTLDARKGFQVVRGRGFELHHLPGRDTLLAEQALKAAEKSREVLAPIFHIPTGASRPPVRIEIYPSAEKFHWASGLSRRDIEVTGAVGITAFNKVMIISPRALTRGYRWVDTLSHEYVHYLLVIASKNNAPIWFHEGLAKYLETRWRSQDSLYLGPAPRTLLAEAVRDDSFVSFQQMEPSLVRLPNPRQVQLAYAEGASAIDFIFEHYGPKKFLGIISDLATSPKRKLAESFRAALGVDLARFEKAWKADLRSRALQPVDGVWIPSYKVKDGQTRTEAEDYRAIRSVAARNHLRLGDMLWTRGRQKPAIMEYVRAVRESPGTPYLRNRLAMRLMAVGREKTALRQLEQARRLGPDYGPTHTLLGHVHLRGGRMEEAKSAYLESFQINPFDPSIHQGLSMIYSKLGDTENSRKAAETFRRLTQGPSRAPSSRPATE